MTHGVAERQLRAFVERIERLDEEIRDLNRDKSDVYREAKGGGFDVKALREVIRLRRMEDHERAEREEIVDLYKAALGMDCATRVRAREPHDPETGEIIECGAQGLAMQSDPATPAAKPETAPAPIPELPAAPEGAAIDTAAGVSSLLTAPGAVPVAAPAALSRDELLEIPAFLRRAS